VAIGMQKLSAGSGYEYLTRQVAALDATGRGHSTLSDYYSARGESPGHWYGGGLAGVGLALGDEVTAEQMKLLFGAGLDPVTGERLGRRYAVYANEPTPFEIEHSNVPSPARSSAPFVDVAPFPTTATSVPLARPATSPSPLSRPSSRCGPRRSPSSSSANAWTTTSWPGTGTGSPPLDSL